MLYPKNIAVIGFGEAGSTIAEGCIWGAKKLHAQMFCHAWDIKMQIPGQKAKLRRTAEALGVRLHDAPGPWLGEMDVVFSLVCGEAAKTTALAILPRLREGSVYMDLTTSVPSDMREAGEAFAARNVGFIDGAALGSFRTSGMTVPFVLSGTDAESWSSWMNSLGFASTPVPGKPGGASSVNLLRNALAKGLEALAIECFVAADRLGLRHSLANAFNDFDLRPLASAMEDMGASHIAHSRKRLEAISHALRMLDEAQIDCTMTKASRDFYERTVRAAERHAMPDGGTWDACMESFQRILQKP